MDAETLAMLGKSVRAWCEDNETRLNGLENTPLSRADADSLFHELDNLGILSVWAEQETRHDIHAVAEIAFQSGRYSPSLAVMVIQQNMAARLMTEGGLPVPTGWISLPLFDAPDEWNSQLMRYQREGVTLIDGCWQDFPLLPVAQAVLLPLPAQNTSGFQFLHIPLQPSRPQGIDVSAPAITLGLRGCSQADLSLQQFDSAQATLLLQGQKALAGVETLWSQAETCVMAVRAGIAEACYRSAHDYANQRYQGGKIIIRHSLIRRMLADLYRETCVIDEQWRSITQTLQPGTSLTPGQMGVALNSAEKLPWLTSDGIQILGGVGYMEDYPQERRYRDAKQCEFLLGHPQARNLALWQTQAD